MRASCKGRRRGTARPSRQATIKYRVLGRRSSSERCISVLGAGRQVAMARDLRRNRPISETGYLEDVDHGTVIPFVTDTPPLPWPLVEQPQWNSSIVSRSSVFIGILDFLL